MAAMPDSEATVTAPTDTDLAADERALRREELAARREEAQAKLRAAAAPVRRATDPLVLAVVAGILTLAGNTLLAYYNSNATIVQERTKADNALKQEERKAADDLALEREKAKATLILQAVATNDPDAARRNLLFFLDGGLIKDDGQKIHKALEKYAPVLPSSSGQASRPPPSSTNDYETAFWEATLRPEWANQLDSVLSKIIDARPRLERVAQPAHTPWYIIGVIWSLETGGNFSVHLHNGDPLSHQTVHVPKGRPENWPPPPGVDPWEYSAADALGLYYLDKLEGVPLGEVLRRLERFNGLGYQKRGLFSPFLWTGTDLYEKGKYVSGELVADAVSTAPGAAALLRRLHDRKIIDLHNTPTASRQDVQQ
jgi:lysozyme family protein